MLIENGFGLRKKEKMVSYLLRVQYCAAKNIPFLFVNSIYPIYGKMAQMVDLKMHLFAKAHPYREFKTVVAHKDKFIKQGRVGNINENNELEWGNWVRVEWSEKKARELAYYHESSAQWKYNILSMLNARANGQVCDILGDFGENGAGQGWMSTEEVNALGIDVKPLNTEVEKK